MLDFHIVNHAYHVKRIVDSSARIIVLGPKIEDARIVLTIPLWESFPIQKKLISPARFWAAGVIPYLRDADRIYFWGAQDVISCEIMALVLERFKVLIVPDNIEFFLRFYPGRRISVRGLLKAAIYRKLLSTISGNAHEGLGRFVFKLPKSCLIDEQYAFYNADGGSLNDRMDAAAHWTFVSQPYHLDHNIKEGIWTTRVVSVLKRIEVESGADVRVLFHPRDNNSYREAFFESGFVETRALSSRCVGVFSTLLFEAALAGIEVRFILEDVKDLLGENYVDFANWLADCMRIKVDSSEPILISPENFRAIFPTDFDNLFYLQKG